MNAYDKHFNKYPIYLIIKTIYWHIAYIQTYMLYLQRYKYSDVKCFPTTGGSQISSWWLYIGSICMLNPGKALCSGPSSVTLLSVRYLKKNQQQQTAGDVTCFIRAGPREGSVTTTLLHTWLWIVVVCQWKTWMKWAPSRCMFWQLISWVRQK